MVRQSRIFLFLLTLSLAACAAYIKPLWSWFHMDSGSVGAVTMPDGKVVSVSWGAHWADENMLIIAVFDESGSVVSRWEFDSELAPDPDKAAEVGGKLFFANGFGSPLSLFDLQTGEPQAIPLTLPDGMTGLFVSAIQSAGNRLVVLGTVRPTDAEDQQVRSLWVLDSQGNEIEMQLLEGYTYSRPLQKLNDGSFVFRADMPNDSGLGDTVFRYGPGGLEQFDLTPDEYYVGANDSGLFVWQSGAAGNHVRYLSWSGQLISVWPSEIKPSQVIRLAADDIIAEIRGDLYRIAPGGSVVWHRDVQYSTAKPGETFTHFDISERPDPATLMNDHIMVGPDGDILVGLLQYKGRVHGFLDGSTWIRNQMNVVFERYDIDGNKVKTYQDDTYTRIMQASVNCYQFVCANPGDRVEREGACDLLEARINEQGRLVMRGRHCHGLQDQFGHRVSVFEY